MRNLILAASAVLGVASAANAGGYAAPIIEIPPVVAVESQPDWQGFYVGAGLGYAFNADDRIGEYIDHTQNTIGNARLHGPHLTVRAGYRWQRQKWVFGPELAYTRGNVRDSFEHSKGEFESRENSVLSLRFKTGRLVRPDTQVYGFVGWQKGDFTYVDSGKELDYDADGGLFGVGVEKKLTEHLSITGELEHGYFGKTPMIIDTDKLSKATPEHSNIRIGLNYQF